MEKKSVVIYLPVFNSFQNLDEIFLSFGSLELNIVKIIIIDNASTIPKNEKLKIIETLKNKYSYEIIFLINDQNYGIGGSKKFSAESIQNFKESGKRLQKRKDAVNKLGVKDMLNKLILGKKTQLNMGGEAKVNTKLNGVLKTKTY